MYTPDEGDCGWQLMVLALLDRKASLLAWDISTDQEEPWRRFLQELSGSRYQEYAESRRHLGVATEFVWLALKHSGRGVAVARVPHRDRHEETL